MTRTRAWVDEARIGLIGHSEGGVVAPMVANVRGDVAFIVLMAATGVDGKTVLLSQSEAMLRAANAPKRDIEVAMAVNHAVMDVAAKARHGEDLTAGMMQAVDRIIETIPAPQREAAGQLIRAQVGGQSERFGGLWMRHFLAYNPAPALADLACPVLAIWGTKDLQVLPELNAPAIRKALAGNPAASFVQLEGLNHMFQAAETGLLTEYAEIDETINPAALEAITSWLTKVAM